MANQSFEIKYYRVFLGADTFNNVKILGYVNCLNAVANWTRQHTVYFVEENASLPPSGYNAAIKSGYTFRRISQMALHVDLLRNEKPVFASIDDANPEVNALRTYPEPVGESE